MARGSSTRHNDIRGWRISADIPVLKQNNSTVAKYTRILPISRRPPPPLNHLLPQLDRVLDRRKPFTTMGRTDGCVNFGNEVKGRKGAEEEERRTRLGEG